jgi:outer membrane protein insertion porin family
MSLVRLLAACLLPLLWAVPAAAQPASPPPSASTAAPAPGASTPTTRPSASTPTARPSASTSRSAAPGTRPNAAGARSAAPTPAQTGGTIQTITVQGNQRIEAGTIRSYILLQPGDPFDPDRLDRSLKTLYATGLFQDVQLNRQGSTLVVQVVENPLVAQVAFEGNHEVNEDALRPEMQLKPRGVYTPALAEADRRKILDLYAQKGSTTAPRR